MSYLASELNEIAGRMEGRRQIFRTHVGLKNMFTRADIEPPSQWRKKERFNERPMRAIKVEVNK